MLGGIFQATMKILVEQGHLDKRRLAGINTSIIIAASAPVSAMPPSILHLPNRTPEDERRTEVSIDADSWHVLRHWAKQKNRTTGDLMVVQISYSAGRAPHPPSGQAPLSLSPLKASSTHETSMQPISPLPVYLNANPQLVSTSPDPFAYDDQSVDYDHNLNETSDVETESVINDIFICVGCTHHFEMSTSINIDEPEHISLESRREGEEAGWFCYSCLSDAYRKMRDQMDEMRNVLQEPVGGETDEVEVENLLGMMDDTLDLAASVREESQIGNTTILDISSPLAEQEQLADTQSPTDSEQTLTAQSSPRGTTLSWFSLAHLFAEDIEAMSKWADDATLESPHKEAKQVEEQLSALRLQFTILRSSKSQFFLCLIQYTSTDRFFPRVADGDLAPSHLVSSLNRLSTYLERRSELLADRPRLWLGLLPLCPAPQLHMQEDALSATERLHNTLERLIVKAESRYETKLGQATRSRVEQTLKQLAGKASQLKMLPPHLSHLNGVYIQKLRITLNSIVDLVRWIWEDEAVSQKEIAEVKDGIASVVQGAMDIIWHFENLDKAEESMDYQSARESLDEMLVKLLYSIKVVAKCPSVPTSPGHEGFVTAPLATPTARPVSSIALSRAHLPPVSLDTVRPASSLALMRARRAGNASPLMEKIRRIDSGDRRLIRPSMQPLPSRSRSQASDRDRERRSRTPADGIPVHFCGARRLSILSRLGRWREL
jgi:dsDNA-binding SOS-regulon protein